VAMYRALWRHVSGSFCLMTTFGGYVYGSFASCVVLFCVMSKALLVSRRLSVSMSARGSCFGGYIYGSCASYVVLFGVMWGSLGGYL